MIGWIILAIWIIGMIVAFFLVRKSESSIMVKYAEIVLWPLTLVLYIIYLIHRGCS